MRVQAVTAGGPPAEFSERAVAREKRARAEAADGAGARATAEPRAAAEPRAMAAQPAGERTPRVVGVALAPAAPLALGCPVRRLHRAHRSRAVMLHSEAPAARA